MLFWELSWSKNDVFIMGDLKKKYIYTNEMVFSVDFKCNYWKGNTVSSFVNSRSGRVTSHPVVPLTTDRVWYSMNGTLISWVHFSYCGWEKSSFLISISARQRRLRQGNSPWMQPEIRGRIVQIYSSSLIWILRPFLQKKKRNALTCCQ